MLGFDLGQTAIVILAFLWGFISGKNWDTYWAASKKIGDALSSKAFDKIYGQAFEKQEKTENKPEAKEGEGKTNAS